MSTAEATELTDILNRVTTWPTTLRIRLARKILESVDQVEAPAETPPSKTRGSSSTEARELPKKICPPPDDEAARFLEMIGAQPGTPPPRNGSLKDLLGILKTDGPAPTDEECRAILEEELIKKHVK